MGNRLMISWTLAGVIVGVSLGAIPLASQAPTTAAKTTPAPKTTAGAKAPALRKTEWGDPDVQGIWTADDMRGDSSVDPAG